MNNFDKCIVNILLKLGLMRIFFTKNQLQTISRNLSEKLLKHFTELNVKKISLLWLRKGGQKTFEDLLANSTEWLDNFSITLNSSIGFSSYKNDTKKGESELIPLSPEEKKIVANTIICICDDLIDSGGSSKEINEYLESLSPTKIIFCFSFNKERGNRVFEPIHFLFGEKIETKLFLVGYGLDFYEELRDIRFLFGLQPWFFKLLGFWPLKNWFISLIKRYDRAMSDFCV